MRVDQFTEVRKYYDGSDESPLLPGVMQVYYDGEVPRLVNLLCPCGCGSECPTRLVTPQLPRAGNSPIWDYSSTPTGPTLSPSIRWTSGCRAHFTITAGRVEFHADSGKQWTSSESTS